MEIRRQRIHLLADFDRGISMIEAPELVETRLGPVYAACQFRAGDESHLLSKNRPDAVLMENDILRVRSSWRGEGAAERVNLDVRVNASEDDEGLIFVAEVTNGLASPIQLEWIDLLSLDVSANGKLSLGFSAAEWSIFRHGWQSWSACRTYRLIERDLRPRFRFLQEMEENPANTSSNRYGVFNSEQVLSIRNTSSGQTAVIGFLTSDRAFGDIRLVVNTKTKMTQQLRARCHFDGTPIAPGESRKSEVLWLRFAGRNHDLLSDWAERSGQAMKARVSQANPSGWCSWYYYYTKVNEDDLRINLQTLTPLREELGLDYFQLDDGYESAIGDWLTTNDKFPSGLPSLAAEIENAGFRPGIWTAPFLVHEKSELAREHPDWLLRNAKGRPIRGAYNPLWDKLSSIKALDPTHPEVRAWLTSLFSALREMGWQFFKIDFLYAASLPAVRHDENQTRASALRAGLQAIREGIGEDAFLLGCGCPLGPAVGIVDAMRIGPDVTPRWANPMRWLFRDHHCLSTLHAIRNTIHRSFLHRAWWLNDPDCVLVREEKNKMNIDEIHSFASLAAISGGLFLMSDDMTELSSERLQILRTALSHQTRGMRVLDRNTGEFPTKLLAKTEDGYFLLVINYYKAEVSQIFDLKEILDLDELARLIELREIWSNQVLHQHDGLIRLGLIPAHGCRLVQIKIRKDEKNARF